MQVFNNKPIIGEFAYGGPVMTGLVKDKPDDFVVEEQLGFDLTGEGEHVFCYIEKVQLNTETVLKKLASILDLSPKLISYAGIKDKQSVSRQWFSIHLPGKDFPDVEFADDLGFTILKKVRHKKKLHIGALSGNQFTIRIKSISGDRSAIIKRLRELSTVMPNYFTEQRFGIASNNLMKANDYLFHQYKVKNRHLRSLYLSAARSWLFNLQLANRIKHNCWNQAIVGDVMMLSGCQSVFAIDELDETIYERINNRDIAPSGILCGMGKEALSAEAKVLFEKALADESAWHSALKEKKLKQMFRPLCIYPQRFQYAFEGDDLVLSFFLPKGSYATALIRELCHLM